MARMTVMLSADERDALKTLAEHEFRDARAQAALIIRTALESAGLLPLKMPVALTQGRSNSSPEAVSRPG